MAFDISKFIDELKKAKTDEEKTKIIRKYSSENDLNNAVYIEEITNNILLKDIIKLGFKKARLNAKKEVSFELSNIPQKTTSKLKKEDYEAFIRIVKEETED